MNKILLAQKFDVRMRGTIWAVLGLGLEAVPPKNCLFTQKLSTRMSTQSTGPAFLCLLQSGGENRRESNNYLI